MCAFRGFTPGLHFPTNQYEMQNVVVEPLIGAVAVTGVSQNLDQAARLQALIIQADRFLTGNNGERSLRTAQ